MSFKNSMRGKISAANVTNSRPGVKPPVDLSSALDGIALIVWGLNFILRLIDTIQWLRGEDAEEAEEELQLQAEDAQAV